MVDTIPKSYEEAISSEKSNNWIEAMNEEMTALEENNTWELQRLPAGRQAIGCKWIFTNKTDANGNLIRYKARLVAKGFNQREGIDYFETFALVVRYESIRVLLSICASEDLEIARFDVKTAFLNGELKEDIYMEQPTGFKNEEKSDLVCKLHRSFYGLKQSPRCWNEKFVKFLCKFSFESIQSDQCVFVARISGEEIYLVLYVDDGLILSKSLSAINDIIDHLQKEFKITIEKSDQFLGFEIERDRQSRALKIKQSNYIKRSNAVSVPAEPGVILNYLNVNINVDDKENLNVQYREAIGSLLYAAKLTRPDIKYAVNSLSQFVNNFSIVHWNAVKKIFRYLCGTLNYGVTYKASGSKNKLLGFTDADYAGCLDTRRSRSGFVFLLNEAPVSWCSQRQNIVSLSTTEAEYIALAQGTKDAIWLRRMLNELNVKCETVTIFVDNQSDIKLANNPEFHNRTKHIDVRYHFVREIVNKREIEIEYVQSNKQLADILTKPLTKDQFCNLRGRMNVTDN